MILDKNTILCDGLPTQSANIKAVDTGFIQAGRKNILFYFNVSEDLKGGSTLNFSLHESESENGSFTVITGSTFSLSASDLQSGVKVPYKFLPQSTQKRWIKLVVSAEGTFTAGKVLCALVREDEQEYAEGMYFDKGVLIA